MTIVDFWFDYSCPYAYLGSTQIEQIAARTGAMLRWCPMLLGGVFHANGTPQNLSGMLSPAKARHNLLDMQRWAELFGVSLTMPEAHPMRTVEALRATLLSGIDPAVIHGFYQAYWVEGVQPSSPEVLRSVLTRAGHDAEVILAHIAEPSVKEELRRRTDEAIALGIFGAPTCIVNEKDLFWGQDRLHFVERALRDSVLSC